MVIYTDEDIYQAIARRPTSEPGLPVLGGLHSHLSIIERTLDCLAKEITKKYRGENRTKQRAKLHRDVMDTAQEMMLENDYYVSQLGLHVAFWAARRHAPLTHLRDVYEAFSAQTKVMLLDHRKKIAAARKEKRAEHKKTRRPKRLRQNEEGEPDIVEIAKKNECDFYMQVADNVFNCAASLPPNSNAGIAFFAEAVNTLVDLASYNMPAYQQVLINQIDNCLEPTCFPGAVKIVTRSLEVLSRKVDHDMENWFYEGNTKAEFNLAKEMVKLSASLVANYFKIPSIAEQARQTFEHNIEIAQSINPYEAQRLLKKLSDIRMSTGLVPPDHKGINDLRSLIRQSETLGPSLKTVSHGFKSSQRIFRGTSLMLH